MDFLTQREIDGLKGDAKGSQIALDAQKAIFETQLKNGLGGEIREELRKEAQRRLEPPKPVSRWERIKESIRKILIGK